MTKEEAIEFAIALLRDETSAFMRGGVMTREKKIDMVIKKITHYFDTRDTRPYSYLAEGIVEILEEKQEASCRGLNDGYQRGFIAGWETREAEIKRMKKHIRNAIKELPEKATINIEIIATQLWQALHSEETDDE